MSNSSKNYWLEARKRYRTIIYSTGLVSLTTVLFAVFVEGFLGSAQKVLVSSSFDPPFFTALKLIFSAVFGSALVGAIFDGFQSRVLNSETSLVSTLHREGFVDVFESDNDPNFITWIKDEVANANDEIIFVGLGLGFLTRNRDLLDLICKRLAKNKGLTARFIVGSENSVGVVGRVREEAAWHDSAGIAYDDHWLRHNLEEIRSYVLQALESSAVDRVSFSKAMTFPSTAIYRVDDLMAFYFYGAPVIRGSQRPIIVINNSAVDGYLVKCINANLMYYVDPKNQESTEATMETKMDSKEVPS